MNNFKREYARLDTAIADTEKRLQALINDCISTKNKDIKLEYSELIEEIAQVLVRLHQINVGLEY